MTLLLSVLPLGLAIFALQDNMSVLARIWYHLNRPVQIGSVEIVVIRLVQGLLILIVALALSRTLSRLLNRSIEKRAYLDPGIRYTLGRITQYLIVTLGALRWAGSRSTSS